MCDETVLFKKEKIASLYRASMAQIISTTLYELSCLLDTFEASI